MIKVQAIELKSEDRIHTPFSFEVLIADKEADGEFLGPRVRITLGRENGTFHVLRYDMCQVGEDELQKIGLMFLQAAGKVREYYIGEPFASSVKIS